MDALSCPSCGRDTSKRLAEVTADSNVAYYRCLACGHVWGVFEDGSPLHHVTSLNERETTEQFALVAADWVASCTSKLTAAVP